MPGRWQIVLFMPFQVKKWASSNVPSAMRPQTENYVVSRYIEDPLLIGGKKFDLRIYVVVLNYKPLQVRHAPAASSSLVIHEIKDICITSCMRSTGR